MKEKPKVLSLIQPTSELHIGNYFGAIVNWVQLQNSEKYECIYGIANLHAMTMPYAPKELIKNTEEMIISLIACGINPDKSIIFIQSLIPEHSELYWILGCVTSYGDLTRMTQFKEKSDKLKSEADESIDEKNNDASGIFISSGLLTYPVLQAADILIYRSRYVPVGKDQEQHLELSRSIARRFNSRFGNFFPEPAPLFTECPKIMSPSDPEKKMSKSLGDKHYIGLFDEPDVIRRKIKSAVTDMGGNTLVDKPHSLITGNEFNWTDIRVEYPNMSAGTKNLFDILAACGKNEDMLPLLNEYSKGNLKYVHLKDAVSSALEELILPIRLKRDEIEKNRDWVGKKVKEMSERARDIAKNTLRETHKLIGLPVKE